MAVSDIGAFGGRKNEAVIYALTSKGRMDFQVALAGSGAPVSGALELIDPATRPALAIGPDFSAKQAQDLHRESDDLFQLITQQEKISTPRTRIQTRCKVFYLSGVLRDYNVGSVSQKPFDITAALYVTLLPGVASGPDVALQTSQYLFWTPNPAIAPFLQVPPDAQTEFGPATWQLFRDLLGLTGIELEAVNGKAPFFISWTNMPRKYPNAGWPEGLDLKLLDDDAATGNMTQMIRLRPGKESPFFSIAGNTHLFVLQGNTTLTPANSQPIDFPQGRYAFVPKGFVFKLANPVQFPAASP